MAIPSLQYISELTAEAFNAPMHQVLTHCPSYLDARRAAIMLALDLTREKPITIAKFFGTTSNSIFSIADRANLALDYDKSFRDSVAAIKRKIGEVQFEVVTRIRDVQRAAEDAFLVPHAIMISPQRTKSLALQRHVAMYIAYSEKLGSLPEIGRAFRRHHTSVLHAFQKVSALVEDGDVDTITMIATVQKRAIEIRDERLASVRATALVVDKRECAA